MQTIINAFADESGDEELAAAVDAESEDYDPETAITAVKAYAATVADDAEVTYVVQDEETMAEEDETANGADLKAAEVYEKWNVTAR